MKVQRNRGSMQRGKRNWRTFCSEISVPRKIKMFAKKLSASGGSCASWFQLASSRLLPANPLIQTHKEVVAEKLCSLPVGIFFRGSSASGADLNGQCGGQISSKIRFCFIPP